MKITLQELLLYLSDELSPEERRRMDQELERSPEARQALNELRKQEAELQHLPLQEPSRDLVAAALNEARRPTRQAIRPSLFFRPAPLLAAAAALLLMLGGPFLAYQPAPERFPDSPGASRGLPGSHTFQRRRAGCPDCRPTPGHDAPPGPPGGGPSPTGTIRNPCRLCPNAKSAGQPAGALPAPGGPRCADPSDRPTPEGSDGTH